MGVSINGNTPIAGNWLVGGFTHEFYFPFHIWDVILTIDELHHFSRWLHHQPNQIYSFGIDIPSGKQSQKTNWKITMFNMFNGKENSPVDDVGATPILKETSIGFSKQPLQRIHWNRPAKPTAFPQKKPMALLSKLAFPEMWIAPTRWKFGFRIWNIRK